MKVRCPSKFCMRTNCRGVGFPCSRHGSDFSVRPCGLSSSAVHPGLSPEASSFRELYAFSRVLRQTSCPLCPEKPCGLPEAKERLPWGSTSLIAASASGVHSYPGIPSPELRSVLDVSHVHDGLLRQKPCGFISPRCHVQGLPYRDLSLTAEPYRVSPADSCLRAVERGRL